MTGIVINNNEYTINTGSTKIEYSSMGEDTCGYSMYGDDIPIVRMLTLTINALPDNATITTQVVTV